MKYATALICCSTSARSWRTDGTTATTHTFCTGHTRPSMMPLVAAAEASDDAAELNIVDMRGVIVAGRAFPRRFKLLKRVSN